MTEGVLALIRRAEIWLRVCGTMGRQPHKNSCISLAFVFFPNPFHSREFPDEPAYCRFFRRGGPLAGAWRRLSQILPGFLQIRA